jgi:hypothetical protein
VHAKEDCAPEADVLRGLSARANMEWMDLSTKIIAPEMINQTRAEDARKLKVIRIGVGETGPMFPSRRSPISSAQSCPSSRSSFSPIISPSSSGAVSVSKRALRSFDFIRVPALKHMP